MAKKNHSTNETDTTGTSEMPDNFNEPTPATRPIEELGRADGDMVSDFAELIRLEASAVGVKITDRTDDLKKYIAERATILSMAIGEPGYRRAVVAERNNIAMFAARHSVGVARDLDGRFLSVIQGGVGILARAMLPV